jgi:excinuclease ABC subunit B
MERPDVVIVATVSCIYGLGNPTSFREMRTVFRTGDQLSLQEAGRRLVSLQYTRNDPLLERGAFRIRGDVLEVFPAYMQEAYRIEMDWDTVRRIRRFHPVSGDTIEEVPMCTVYPAKHFVLPEEQVRNAVGIIEAELAEQYRTLIAQNKLVEAQRLKSRTEYDIEMLREMGYCSGIENYSRTSRQEGGGAPRGCSSTISRTTSSVSSTSRM